MLINLFTNHRNESVCTLVFSRFIYIRFTQISINEVAIRSTSCVTQVDVNKIRRTNTKKSNELWSSSRGGFQCRGNKCVIVINNHFNYLYERIHCLIFCANASLCRKCWLCACGCMIIIKERSHATVEFLLS